jgi:CRP/FNR family cyclic AMP-dependent transcriptional regulator
MEWPLLRSVPEDERRKILGIASRRRFAKNEVVCHAGDPGDTLHLVASGRFSVRLGTRLGDAATLSLVGPGDYFGILALLKADARRTATVTAMERAETLSIRKDDFEHLRRQQPSVTEVLLSGLGQQVERLSEALVEALYTPVEVRLLRRLLDASRLWGGPADGVVVPLTQEDLGDLAGTTRPTANRVLREAEKRGMLNVLRGRVELRDVALLTRRAGC